MAYFAMISGLVLIFECNGLLALGITLGSSHYLCAIDGRFTCDDCRTITDKKDFVQFNSGAINRIQEINLDNLSGCYPVLLTTSFNNSVNV
jgi:hypothetical protein